jgi:hypothetical protein
VRYDKEFRGNLTTGNHHQPKASTPVAALPPSAVHEGAEIHSRLGGRPVDADIYDLAQWRMQCFDELRQFMRH